MTALGMVLNSLGIKVTDEHRAQIEALIPQIPARVVQAVEVINASVGKVNENTQAIQALREEIAGLKTDFGKLCGLLEEVLNAKRAENGIDTGIVNPGDALGTEQHGDTLGTGGRYLPGNPTKRKQRTNGVA